MTPAAFTTNGPEAAEYAGFIRDWLDTVASKNLVAEAGA